MRAGYSQNSTTTRLFHVFGGAQKLEIEPFGLENRHADPSSFALRNGPPVSYLQDEGAPGL